MPYVYVTTSNNIQATSYPFGSTIPNNIHQTSVQYEIVLVAHARDKTVNSQKQLYTLVTGIRDALEADPTFENPSTNDDPIF